MTTTLSPKAEKAIIDAISYIQEKSKDIDTCSLKEFLERRLAATERAIENFSSPYPKLIIESKDFKKYKKFNEDCVTKYQGMVSAYKDVLKQINEGRE